MIWVAIILIAFATLMNAFLIHHISDKTESIAADSAETQVDSSQANAIARSVDRRLDDTNNRLDDTINKANANDIRLNNMATRNKLDIARANKQIDDIIIKLQEITADIHRLDGNITDVAKSEHEIRSYYVNFREPRFDNAGVEWSEEYVTHDD